MDDDGGPEAGAVLAQAPGLVLVFARGPRRRERRLRFSLRAILLGVKLAEMLADDVFRLVLGNPLRPGIPIGHTSVGIEHEDRIIRHGVDEEPEATLALQQRLLPLP